MPKYSKTFKKNVIRESLKKEVDVVAKEYKLEPSLVAKWRNEFLSEHEIYFKSKEELIDLYYEQARIYNELIGELAQKKRITEELTQEIREKGLLPYYKKRNY